ncbi:MAG: hypothetical protein R3F30_12435 [Planctomycetota bacterium]
MTAPGTGPAPAPGPEPLHLLGGIDEAGLGPLLGPLVVAGLLLEGPGGANAWTLCEPWFCKQPRDRRDRRIRVDDSKKVKVGARGHAQLERTALSLTLAAEGALPADVGALLGPDLAGELMAYPWYEGLAARPLPRWNDRRTLELEAHLARQGMERSGVRCLLHPFHCLPVGRFNEAVARHDNKSLVLFEASLAPLVRIVEAAARRAGDDAWSLRVVIDRQGARGRYRSLLARAFPGTDVAVVQERPGHSEYAVGGHTHLSFVEKGEDRSFPTAAASCLAKYVRELLIEALNEWFRGRRPDLRPTAGYYSDGRRFLDDLGDDLVGLPRQLLVRCR